MDAILAVGSSPTPGAWGRWHAQRDGLQILRPLALAHHRCDRPILSDAVDVDLTGPDHPVDVDVAGVAAAALHLFGGDRLAIDEALRLALAECDVARGILVEQGVVEEDPRLAVRGR